MKGSHMKKFLISSVLFMLGLTAGAEAYPYLSFQYADGSAASFGIGSLSMTFSDSGSKLVVSNGSTSQTLNVADIMKMFFTANDVSGISVVTPEDTDSRLEVYDISGIYIGKFANARSLGETVEPGIYLVRQNGKTKKIAVR